MPSPPNNDRGSMLLVEECFASEHAGFLEALRRIDSPKLLAAFADRWKKDARPWAREQILAYLDLPLNSPGHEPLIKHLFKDAEERKDDALMAVFLVAFDTLVRRVRKHRWRWDPRTRSSSQDEYLAVRRDVLPKEGERKAIDPRTGRQIVVPIRRRIVPGGRLFSYRTRYYLRRRAWRYFRWLGYARPEDFPAVVATALRRYQDSDLAKGENILDSWALLNICFRGSDALEFLPAHLRLKPGRTLAELRAAPRFVRAWETADAGRILIELAARAPAQLVRMWAMDLFRGIRSKVAIELSADELLSLLDCDDDRVQQFGAEMFGAQGGHEKLPVAVWLRLLKTRNLTALATLCDAFVRHVGEERLTLPQCLEFACAKATPLARLGWQFLKNRKIARDETAALAALADAQCSAVAGELCAWALSLLGTREAYDLEKVSRFFDSLCLETREAAWVWLAPGSAGYDDPVLWSRLAETPFDDLRLKLVDHLALRVKMPALSADALSPVWCAVLLGVHRGGRQKLKAVRQIADAIERDPAEAAKLAPVLAVAVRSVRGPEMRAGLAAVMTLLAARPELADSIRARLPELSFEPGEAVA